MSPTDPDEMVAIWSEEHRSYWRPDAKGYTTHVESIGTWPRAEAEAMVAHCSPEKQIELRPWRAPLLAPAVAYGAGFRDGVRECIDVVQRARQGEIDNDLRSIIHRIGRLAPAAPDGETPLMALAEKINRWLSLVEQNELLPRVALSQIRFDLQASLDADRERR